MTCGSMHKKWERSADVLIADVRGSDPKGRHEVR
jgi:hypothetical protein